MRNRLESFKSAKMGLAPAKTITKHTKKDQQQKVIFIYSIEYMGYYTIAKTSKPFLVAIKNVVIGLISKTLIKNLARFGNLLKHIFCSDST